MDTRLGPPGAQPDITGGPPPTPAIGSNIQGGGGFHLCVVEDEEFFDPDTFREMDAEVDGRPVIVLIAKRLGETFTDLQAIRYDSALWSASDARTHCKSHGGALVKAKAQQLPEAPGPAAPPPHPPPPTGATDPPFVGV